MIIKPINEYDAAFPFEQEYQSWINGVESDYREECEYRAKLAVTNRVKLFVDGNELSPYATVNS